MTKKKTVKKGQAAQMSVLCCNSTSTAIYKVFVSLFYPVTLWRCILSWLSPVKVLLLICNFSCTWFVILRYYSLFPSVIHRNVPQKLNIKEDTTPVKWSPGMHEKRRKEMPIPTVRKEIIQLASVSHSSWAHGGEREKKRRERNMFDVRSEKNIEVSEFEKRIIWRSGEEGRWRTERYYLKVTCKKTFI